MNNTKILQRCKLCVRECNVDRLSGVLGFCKASAEVKIAKAALHFWEEPCISGEEGSGTVFFSHCNLSCVFCQNYEISQKYRGKEISIERLSEIFLELQQKGANNINLVTPTHYVPQIIEAIKLGKNRGLKLPILYNTNGYDTIETIKTLEGCIDVYLPDFKFFDKKYAIKYSKAPGYVENIKNIIKEMFHQVGEPKFNEKGLIEKGVIIRHLMLPGLLFDSKKVLDEIYTTFGHTVYLSLMNQYIPMNKTNEYPEINKPLYPSHYDSMIDYALSIGIKNGFVQDSGTNNISYVPKFDNEGV
ncbi:radical SAM protein [Clostridium polyendosporum]|uniref:Radical SAM protein n=1 Tax=Clostridium polyendosporum TaxID=69208 RepID=A0A919S0N5_9CLOT|nr:radical SAM protein [Clostridium polyendosporum]GIM28990.1 radical SAM protein [Clostridium polyendosporum]